MTDDEAGPTLHHVSLKTNQLHAMITWYSRVAGFRVIHQFEGGAWLTNDAANHRLGLLCSPQLSDDPQKLLRTGIHHTAFEFTSLDRLLDNYVRLKAAGIEPADPMLGIRQAAYPLSFQHRQ